MVQTRRHGGATGGLCLLAGLLLAAALVSPVPGASGGTSSETTSDATPAATAPEPVQVTSHTDHREVRIGTPFRYTIEIRAPRGVELTIPVLGERLGELSVVDFGEEPVREEGGDVVVTRWFSLVAYRPGYLLIPGLTVQYRAGDAPPGRVDGEDSGIVVTSLLEAAPAADDIRDIKPPVSVPFDWTPVWIVLGVAGGLAVIGALLLRLARRRQMHPGRIERAPDLEALEALARLQHRRLADPEAVARWYVELSAIVRIYIERRFGVRAPEMTTEEFIVAAQRDLRLGPGHREILAGFLGGCDLVKFARHVPDAEAAARAYEAVRRFVEETRPAPEAVEGAVSRAA